MAKHTQTIRRQIVDELFECVWPFCCTFVVRLYIVGRNISKMCSTLQKQSPRGVLQKRCSAKKMFLEISQNSQEYICVRVSF